MQSVADAVRKATQGGKFAGRVFLVGGCVRDELLGLPEPDDVDLVVLDSAIELAEELERQGVAQSPPVEYSQFGVAQVQIEGHKVELVTARKDSYRGDSRKPTVEPATLEEDAHRRDFTVNALLRSVETEEIVDPTGKGLEDLKNRVLRTPLDPKTTFHEDPLRMLRAVRFRWRLGFEYAPDLASAIRECAPRLNIISVERIQDEWSKMLLHPTASEAMQDLFDLGLLAQFTPELVEMKGVEQGQYHHLDVWDHTLLVMRNAGVSDLNLSLAAIFHDVGKPPTRQVIDGQTRFFGHEGVSAEITRRVLNRLRFSGERIDEVVLLVKNHMRIMAADRLSDTAIRRLMRDLGAHLSKLLALVEADAGALRPGVKTLDLAPLKARIEQMQLSVPVAKMKSPLNGKELMALTGVTSGPKIGALKQFLLDEVMEGRLDPDDLVTARALAQDYAKKGL